MTKMSSRYRQLPTYVAVSAKRDVWQFIVDEVTAGDEEWAHFRVNAFPDLLRSRFDRNYHQSTISRALKALSDEGYIEYRAGTRGEVSMARPVLEGGGQENTPDSRQEGGGPDHAP